MKKKPYCSMSFTSASQARIKEAEKNDGLKELVGLHCECGAAVELYRSPMGERWIPSLHYPAPPQRHPALKRFDNKSTR